MDPELKAMRQRSRSDMEAVILKLLNFTEPQLDALLKMPELNLSEKFIARFILRGIAKGDQAAFMQISDYVFGKRPDVVHMTSITQTITTEIPLSQMAKNPEVFDTLMILDAKLKGLPAPSK